MLRLVVWFVSVHGYIKKERLQKGPVDNPPGLLHFDLDREFNAKPESLRQYPMFLGENSTFELLNMDHIIESTYENDPKNLLQKIGGSFRAGAGWYPPTVERNKKWKESLYQNPDGDAYQCVRDMFHTKNALPVTPDRLATRLDQVPSTDYIWIFVVYDSNRPRDQCKRKVHL